MGGALVNPAMPIHGSKSADYSAEVTRNYLHPVGLNMPGPKYATDNDHVEELRANPSRRKAAPRGDDDNRRVTVDLTIDVGHDPA